MAKDVNWGMVSIGAGGVMIGGYFIYQEYVKREAIAEYAAEIVEINNFIENANPDGITPAESDVLDRMYEPLETKQMWFEGKGWLNDLIRWTAISLGLAVAGPKIVKETLKYLIRRKYPPNNFPPHCEAHNLNFATEAQLEQHYQEQHQPAAAAPEIQEAQDMFNSLPGWVQALVGAGQGVGDWLFEDNWTGLSGVQIVGIAAACSAILLMFWWYPGTWAALTGIIARLAPAAA